MNELPFLEERRLVAQACRVLVARGLVDGLLGHVSMRVDSDRVLVRCRGPHEQGLADTTAADIRLLTMDGAEGGPDELSDGYTPPHELPLHTELLHARPDVIAVVHAHPAAVVALDLAGLSVRPLLGAFDIPGAALAAAGVPVYPRAILVRDREIALDVAACLGALPAVILRGHGLATVGSSVEEAVLRAISVDRFASMSVQVAAAGGAPRSLPLEDLTDLPDLGQSLNQASAWRHEIARSARILRT